MSEERSLKDALADLAGELEPFGIVLEPTTAKVEGGVASCRASKSLTLSTSTHVPLTFPCPPDKVEEYTRQTPDEIARVIVDGLFSAFCSTPELGSYVIAVDRIPGGAIALASGPLLVVGIDYEEGTLTVLDSERKEMKLPANGMGEAWVKMELRP